MVTRFSDTELNRDDAAQAPAMAYGLRLLHLSISLQTSN